MLELTNCEAGQYVSNAYVCAACPAGTYSSSPGASSCMSCGAGTMANYKSIGCVVACPSGQYNNNGASQRYLDTLALLVVRVEVPPL